MKKNQIEKIKKLREKTGAPMMRVKRVLEELDGDEKEAAKFLIKEGFSKVEKREGRETSQGLVCSYEHHSGKVASVVALLCETDFVARNELFKNLAHDLAMQVASMDPKDGEALKRQAFIKDPAKTVEDKIKELISKTGENIRIGRFFRVELGSK